jgi:hypothetical protein
MTRPRTLNTGFLLQYIETKQKNDKEKHVQKKRDIKKTVQHIHNINNYFVVPTETMETQGKSLYTSKRITRSAWFITVSYVIVYGYGNHAIHFGYER